jgi:hypothetical protein
MHVRGGQKRRLPVTLRRYRSEPQASEQERDCREHIRPFAPSERDRVPWPFVCCLKITAAPELPNPRTPNPEPPNPRTLEPPSSRPPDLASSPERRHSRTVAEAIDGMVIHETDGLHEGIADRRSNELEVAAEQIATQRVGFRGARRDLCERAPAIHPG